MHQSQRAMGKGQNILIKWGYINKAKPDLISTLIKGMSQWRNNEESQPHNNIDPTIHIAFLKQKRIGWDCAFKSILSTHWVIVQHEYFKEMGSRQSLQRSSKNSGTHHGTSGNIGIITWPVEKQRRFTPYC
eukprot:10387887-Ditylum_brightwellii.AAC.1